MKEIIIDESKINFFLAKFIINQFLILGHTLIHFLKVCHFIIDIQYDKRVLKI